MEFDYIVVGQGLAGTVMTHTLRLRGKSVLVIDKGLDGGSSEVAGGIYNPVTGRNYVKTWLADTIFPLIEPFYSALEKELGIRLLYPMPMLRPYQTIEKQNILLSKGTGEGSAKYFLDHHEPAKFPVMKSALGILETGGSGYLAVKRLINRYRKKLLAENLILEESFYIKDLTIAEDGISYKGHRAKAVIFCLGHNPTLGKELDTYATIPVKGEILTVKSEGLPKHHIVNQGVFILPLENGLWRLGSTYESGRNDRLPTDEGRKELLNKMAQLVNVKVEVQSHKAGIRPSILDRQPIAGKHPDLRNAFIMNGLGSKGVSTAPWLAGQIADLVIDNKPIERAADINRYW